MDAIRTGCGTFTDLDVDEIDRLCERLNGDPIALPFATLKHEAKRRGLLLERVDRTRDGVRYRYEITDKETGVWERCRTLADAQQEIIDWENKEVFFVV